MTAAESAPQRSRPEVEAALLILQRLGLSPADLTAAPPARPAVPTFAEYVPVVSAAVTAGTRRAYGPYWNRITGQWGGRRLDELARAAAAAGVADPEGDSAESARRRPETSFEHGWGYAERTVARGATAAGSHGDRAGRQARC